MQVECELNTNGGFQNQNRVMSIVLSGIFHVFVYVSFKIILQVKVAMELISISHVGYCIMLR